jgi:hypothetical protein
MRGLGTASRGIRQAGGQKFEVLQVKEKFGGLRVYVNCHRNEAIYQRLGLAAQESLRTCEICGQSGTLREDRWIKTLCDEHDASGRGYEHMRVYGIPLGASG